MLCNTLLEEMCICSSIHSHEISLSTFVELDLLLCADRIGCLDLQRDEIWSRSSSAMGFFSARLSFSGEDCFDFFFGSFHHLLCSDAVSISCFSLICTEL